MGNFYRDHLPVHVGTVDRLPSGVAALVVTADLQGRETFGTANGQPPRLLGEVLPGELIEIWLPQLNLPNGQIGAILAGDFYTVPGLDKRGGTGDVTAVWDAFSMAFDWVVGVAGNHDTFGSTAEAQFKPVLRHNCHFLDGDFVEIAGQKFAGLSGIIGNPRRPWRRITEDFVGCVADLGSQSPDVLVMHDGPDCPRRKFRGTPMIRETLSMCPEMLVVRGHAHWPEPLARLDSGQQVLNVDARVVVLIAG